jgi:hypothetical protein
VEKGLRGVVHALVQKRAGAYSQVKGGGEAWQGGLTEEWTIAVWVMGALWCGVKGVGVWWGVGKGGKPAHKG